MFGVSTGGDVDALAWMLDREDPADLFDTDVDALADVLDDRRTSALESSIANGNSETDSRSRVRCRNLR